MSAPLPLPASTLSIKPAVLASANLSTGKPLFASGTTSEAESFSALFDNLLSFNLQESDLINSDLASTTLSNQSTTGLKSDQTLLVLPLGISTLSNDTLQAFLAQSSNTTTGDLSNDLLQSLTPGIPKAPSLVNDVMLGEELTLDLPPLSITADQTLSANPLLSASNLSPADMEKLKAALAEKLQQSENDALSNPSDTLALVAFLPVQTQLPVNQNMTTTPLVNEIAVATEAVSSETSAILTPAPLEQNAFQKTQSHLDAKARLPSTQGELNALDVQNVGYIANAEKNEGYISGALSTESDISGTLDGASSLSQTLQGSHLPKTSGMASFDATLSLLPTATNQNQSSLTNPVITHTAAAAYHPATQTVTMVLEKAAGKAEEKGKHVLSVQLDPPELGRIQLQLSYEKGEPMRVHLLAEKKDTLTLLQRDSHALQATLDRMGIQTDGSSLSFDLAGGDQSFGQMLNGSQDQQNPKTSHSFSLAGDGDAMSLEPIQTELPAISYQSGTARYSFLA